jgi:hypothetical protein
MDADRACVPHQKDQTSGLAFRAWVLSQENRTANSGLKASLHADLSPSAATKLLILGTHGSQ